MRTITSTAPRRIYKEAAGGGCAVREEGIKALEV